jgi:hypothetical protein
VTARDEDPIDPALLEAELARPLDARLRDAVPAALPPAGFADRVLLARAAEGRQAPRAGRRVVLGAVAAVLVASLAIGLRLRSSDDAHGAASPGERASIALASRGVAVMAPGAELRWKIEHGRAELEQPRGNVFYRVERGGAFVVHTPAGTVEVRGTCFSVEVGDMKIGRQGIIGATVGAALAGSVVVAVYEGRVSYANEHGQVTLGAGERAAATAGAAPRTLPEAQASAAAVAGPAPATLTRDELVKRAEAQQLELAALRGRLHTFEAQGGASGASGAAGPNDRGYLNPTKEELAELAKECKLRWDEPKIGINPTTVGPERATEMGLSDDERQAMNRVTAEFNTRLIAELRGLYVELTGDTAGADGLSPGSLIEEIEEKSPHADVQAAYQRLARERAGLQAAPADARGLSPIERLMRLRTGAGDRYEKDLGGALGPELAHRLREDKGGWGSRHSSSYGCPAP